MEISNQRQSSLMGNISHKSSEYTSPTGTPESEEEKKLNVNKLCRKA